MTAKKKSSSFTLRGNYDLTGNIIHFSSWDAFATAAQNREIVMRESETIVIKKGVATLIPN